VWVALLSVALAPVAAARVVLDAGDPAFANAVSVALPPAGLTPGAFASEFTVAGITIRMQALSTVPLVSPFLQPPVV